MTITTDNYEEYFYHYCEGELTTKERAAVEAFATRHPDLAEELSLYDPALKLEDAPMVYPDKERLLRREGKVVPLWRWAAAACVAAVLVGGVWLLWSDGKPTAQTGMVAQTRQAAPAVTTAIPASHQETATPTPASKAAGSATPPAMQPSLVPDEPVEPLPQYEVPAFEEPALLAEAEYGHTQEYAPTVLPSKEDTTVIEYIDITIFPTYQSQVEVVAVAYQPTVSDRFRAFRSRVSNTVRDYAYQSYAEARGELRSRINY